MKTVHPSRLLKTALLADAAVSAGAAALQLLAADTLAALTQLPRALLVETGVFLALYVAMLVAMARAARLPAALVRVVVFGNLGWALGCLALAATPLPGALGLAFLIGQAAAVTVFAVLEYRGLASSAPAKPGGAAAAAH